MFSLLTGIGARLQSKAVPDPGHPYTSKTLCPVSDLLGEPDCMDSGLQPLRGRRWMTDFSLLPHQRPCKWKEPSPSPRLTQSYQRESLQIQHIPNNGDFPLCDETYSWSQPWQVSSILLLSFWPAGISLLHLQVLWVWPFSCGNRYDKNTCHCEGQQNITCFCEKYQGHSKLRNTVAAPVKPAK